MSFRPIFGIPRLTQDWGDEQHERETHWTSLFYDLMIVAALNAIAEPFEEPEEAEERRLLTEESNTDESTPFNITPIHHLWANALLQFAWVVSPWNALNEFTSVFEDESFIGHISFFVHAFGMAATTAGCVGELEENYRVLATGIILAKIGLLVLYIRPIMFVKRAWKQVSWRCAGFCVTIFLLVWGMWQLETWHEFKTLLIVTTIWDWSSVPAMFFLLKEADRVPIHIQHYDGRIKEVTMIIFGEAIFAIILQPYSEAKQDTHFYVALAATLWLIYSMALLEFHILPNEDDHALRRSKMFGALWYYTQFFKQCCLLGTSIGIKRAHLLVFEAPSEPLDYDTRRLIVWGLSTTVLSIVMLRSFSFGFGRHPSNDDTPEMYWLKVSWWTCMAMSAVVPQVVDNTIFEHFSSRPLTVLITFGCLMALAIIAEAAMSHLVAENLKNLFIQMGCDDRDIDELTYLRHATPSGGEEAHHYSTTEETSTNNESGGGETTNDHAPKRKCAFPMAHCPKSEK